MKTSVLIRVKNEENFIGYAIQSCLDHIPGEIEIVIIDNNSNDQSINIARMFQHDTSLPLNSSYCSVKFAQIHDYTPGSALNLGVSHATGEYILILSSHCRILSFQPVVYGYLDSHCGVFGNQIPFYQGKKLKKNYIWSHFHENMDVRNMYSSLEERPFFHNALSLFKKSTLVKYPFNPALSGKEDRYWAANMLQQNYCYLYTPKFSAEHFYTSNGNTWKGIG